MQRLPGDMGFLWDIQGLGFRNGGPPAWGLHFKQFLVLKA